MQDKLPRRPSYRESIKELEADIRHANALAAAIPRASGGACLQLKLSYGPLAPFFLFLFQFIDCTCTDALPSYLGLLHVLIFKVYTNGKTTKSPCERKASLKDFYAIIYPSLQLLEGELVKLEDKKQKGLLEGELVKLEDKKQKGQSRELIYHSKSEDGRAFYGVDEEREQECGICMETCTKVVLPDCGHAMCINCYHDWNTLSESCPFCRDSLKRVKSQDLWVLTSDLDVIDTAALAEENLRRFYGFIDSLPLIIPDTLLFVYDYII